MHRRMLLLLTVVILTITTVAVGSAVGRSSGPRTHAPDNIDILGTETFEANALIQATFRFSPERFYPHTGEEVEWVDRDKVADEPHTITVVRHRELPSSIEEVFECEPCNVALGQHFSTDPPTLVVDVGEPGLDQPGDSLLLLPDESIEAQVSAPAGTRLWYLCAIHPWMQGKLVVG